MPVGIPDPVVALAVFLVGVGLVVATLYRGRVGRWEGGLLLVVYGGYWAANLLV